jgi:hypothetical protein
MTILRDEHGERWLDDEAAADGLVAAILIAALIIVIAMAAGYGLAILTGGWPW